MMSTNILRAINRFAQNPNADVLNKYISSNSNRINSQGDALEYYIKDLLADTLLCDSESDRLLKFESCFSYLGNTNNPPDLMIKNGDAIEIKKIETPKAQLALNSSYPKFKLFRDDPKINQRCKDCEIWSEKDILYCVGYVLAKKIRHLWFVYGDCYAAEKETYERIANAISSGIETIGDIEFSKTKELGRVNKVDPLGITALRIRGMWHIANPATVFDYLYNPTQDDIGMACLMKKEKFLSFNSTDREVIQDNPKLNLQEVKIKNPNNPANLIDSILITLK
jgi:hypothetical protein